MSSNVYNLLPHLTPGEPGLLLGSVSVRQPAPKSFADPLHVELPDWSDTNYFTIANWPACHGSLLPQCGADVLILVDTQKNKRVVWWDGLTGFPPQGGVGAADGTQNLALPPGSFGSNAFTFPAALPASAIGGVKAPSSAPGVSNQTILSNGAGGSFWGTISAGGGSSLVARARASSSAAIGGTGYQKVPLNTTVFDPSGMFSVANSRFIVPIAGYYLIEGEAGAVTGATTNTIFFAGIFVNGSEAVRGDRGGNPDADGIADVGVCATLSLNVNDYVELFFFSSSAAWTWDSAVDYLSVTAVSALPGITGTTTVAKAYAGAGFTFTGGNGHTLVPIDTALFDPAGRFDLVNHRYTVPATGAYQINAQITSAAGNSLISALIYLNGVQVSAGAESTAAGTEISNISDIIQCNSGDHIQLYGFNGGVDVASAGSGSSFNFLSVVQVGTAMNFTSAGGDLTGTYPNPQLAPPRAVTNSVSGSANSATAITATTGSWSLTNGMTVSGNGIKVPISGYYEMLATVTGPGSSGVGYLQSYFAVNGSNVGGLATGTAPAPTAENFPQNTAIWEQHCAAGDVITLIFQNSTNITQAINGGVFIVRYTGQ